MSDLRPGTPPRSQLTQFKMALQTIIAEASRVVREDLTPREPVAEPRKQEKKTPDTQTQEMPVKEEEKALPTPFDHLYEQNRKKMREQMKDAKERAMNADREASKTRGNVVLDAQEQALVAKMSENVKRQGGMGARVSDGHVIAPAQKNVVHDQAAVVRPMGPPDRKKIRLVAHDEVEKHEKRDERLVAILASNTASIVKGTQKVSSATGPAPVAARRPTDPRMVPGAGSQTASADQGLALRMDKVSINPALLTFAPIQKMNYEDHGDRRVSASRGAIVPPESQARVSFAAPRPIEILIRGSDLMSHNKSKPSNKMAADQRAGGGEKKGGPVEVTKASVATTSYSHYDPATGGGFDIAAQSYNSQRYLAYERSKRQAALAHEASQLARVGGTQKKESTASTVTLGGIRTSHDAHNSARQHKKTHDRGTNPRVPSTSVMSQAELITIEKVDERIKSRNPSTVVTSSTGKKSISIPGAVNHVNKSNARVAKPKERDWVVVDEDVDYDIVEEEEDDWALC